MKEAAKGVMDWAFMNTDYPALYSYYKYTNEASIRKTVKRNLVENVIKN